MENKQRKKIPWEAQKAIYICAGVILILALSIFLLDRALIALLAWAFPHGVSEVSVGYVNREANVDVSGGTILENWDDHGGFLGDGQTFVKMQFSEADAQALEAQLGDAQWEECPLSTTVKTLCSLTGDVEIPAVTDGSWLLQDRQTDTQGNILERSSFNFTLIVYDRTQRILYYYELDT